MGKVEHVLLDYIWDCAHVNDHVCGKVIAQNAVIVYSLISDRIYTRVRSRVDGHLQRKIDA